MSYIKKPTFEQKLALFALIPAIFAAIIGNSGPVEDVTMIKSIAGKEIDFLDALKVGKLIMSRKIDFSIIDLREEKKFTEYHIPNAININKINPSDSAIFSKKNTLILYGENQRNVSEIWLKFKNKNLKNVLVLKGGINAWANEVLFPDLTNQTGINQESIEMRKKLSLYFGGRPKFNVIGKSTLSRRYKREGC